MSAALPPDPTSRHPRVDHGALIEQSPLEVPVPTQEERRDRDRADAAGIPYLLFREPGQGQRVIPLLEDRVMVGRDEEAAVALRWDRRVSRCHAMIERTGTGWQIADDGRSTNGTFVNRVRVTEPRDLQDRDVVQVGDTALAFRIPGGQLGAGTGVGRFAR